MRKSLLAGAGAVGAAFLGSLCCMGPILFVTFGVGAGLASTFEPLRPLFGVVMLGLFALAFYSVYAKRGGPQEMYGVACASPRRRQHEKLLLWMAAAIALALWTFPTWSVWLV